MYKALTFQVQAHRLVNGSDRDADRVRLGWVRSGQIGSDRVESGWVRSCRIGSNRVGSDREFCEFCESVTVVC